MIAHAAHGRHSAGRTSFFVSRRNMQSSVVILSLIFIPLISGCGIAGGRAPAKRIQCAPRQGQKQPLVSPSGMYVVEMPILKSNQTQPLWTPIIKNAKGETLFTDRQSGLSGYHNSYWTWSDSDALWVYNSDDGGATKYFMQDGRWQKLNFRNLDNSCDPPDMIKKMMR